MACNLQVAVPVLQFLHLDSNQGMAVLETAVLSHLTMENYNTIEFLGNRPRFKEGVEPYPTKTAGLLFMDCCIYRYWRRGRDSNSQSLSARRFSRARLLPTKVPRHIKLVEQEGFEPSVLPLRRRGMVRPEGLEPSLLQIKSLMCCHYTMDALLNVGMLPLLSGVLPSFNHLSLNFL